MVWLHVKLHVVFQNFWSLAGLSRVFQVSVLEVEISRCAVLWHPLFQFDFSGVQLKTAEVERERMKCLLAFNFCALKSTKKLADPNKMKYTYFEVKKKELFLTFL